MRYDIRDLLLDAFAHKASDLHITVNSPPYYRVNGELVPYSQVPVTEEDTEQMAKILLRDESKWREFLDKKEIDFSYQLDNVARFRLNVFFQRDAISIVARVIASDIPTLDQLQMPPIIKKMVSKPQGLILVTGPTGSGKSTTLAAMIDYVNRTQAKHIITLEDPIEYVHENQRSIINQREVGSDTNNFANGLRAALRQDPDVILLGEMRDLETIATAITAAETGHLVLATLHTSSAPLTIERIIDVFPAEQQAQIRTQLASVLEGIISQRLFPRMDGQGRIAATEILVNHPSVANLIRNEKIHQIKNVMQTGRSLGMHTLEMSIQSLLSQGIISSEHATPYLMNVGEV